MKLNQTPHPVVYLRRVKYRDLQNFLNFMYQGEANVAEEDLSSFLEIAEDLNVRGLCKRNTEGYQSNGEETSKAANPNINPSSIRNRAKEQNIKDIYDNDTVHHSFLNNDIDTNIFAAPQEIKGKRFNKLCVDNKTQNLISTVAIQDEVGNHPRGQCNYKTK